MKVTLIGSTTFPVETYARQIAEYISTFPEGTVFLTRAAEGFDRFAGECARIMGYEVEEFPGKGGAFNFERDVNLAKEADKVVAFFAADAIGQGGTNHVVEKALDQRKPIESFYPEAGKLVFAGSDDGEGHRGGGPAEAHWQAPAPREGSSESDVPSVEAPSRPRQSPIAIPGGRPVGLDSPDRSPDRPAPRHPESEIDSIVF